MNRICATLAMATLGLALLGCDDKTTMDAPKPGTGAGAGVGVGGSTGVDPSVTPAAGGMTNMGAPTHAGGAMGDVGTTPSTRPMPGSGGVGNTGSMTPEGASNATGANNVAGGAMSTTRPTP